MPPATDRSRAPGRELAIRWRGRRARAWVPAPLAARDLDCGAAPARRVGEALALVRTVSGSLRSQWEPVARLLLRAEGVASSAIEGIRAPVAEVAAAELDEAAVGATAAWVADNLATVTEALAGAATTALDVELLHSWHRRLMRHGALEPSMVGAFRHAQGWIGGTSPLDAAYVPPPPEAIPALMDDLIAYANGDVHDAVTQAAAVHAQFATIHPYGDGNGRLGRVLVGWVLRRRTGVAVPPPLSVLIARDAGGYLSGLYQFRTGDMDRYLGWFATVLGRSAEATTVVMSSVDELMSKWRSRLADLRVDALAHRLVDLLPVHPVLSSAVVVQETSVSDRTARRALADLAERHIVSPFVRTPRRPGRQHNWWVAAELLEVVSGWSG